MSDDQPIAGASQAVPPGPIDPAERMRSDVVRLVDLERLEESVMSVVRENSRAVTSIGVRVDGLRDELSGYVIQHAQDHSSQAAGWEQRWSGMAIDIAYRKGLIGFPRLVLEWLRQYLTTILTIGGIAAIVIGFLTGQVSVGVGQ